MKKTLSLLLTFAMLMSMSVTAFAAESQDVTATYTPTYEITVSEAENGTVTADVTSAAEGDTVTLTVTPDSNYELDTLTVTDASSNSVTVTNNQFTMPASAVTVSATFKETSSGGDTTATITSVSVSGGASYDETTKTYTVTPDGEKITITVTGTNLNNATTDNLVVLASGHASTLNEGTWTISGDGTTATKTFENSEFKNCTTAFEIQYSNGGTTGDAMVGTGIYIVYDSGEEAAEITSVSVSGGASYDETTNTYTVTPDGNKITITVTGTNLDNATNSNLVIFASGSNSALNGGAWTISTDGTTATQTFENSRFDNCTTAFEIQYSNGGSVYGALVGTGIKVVYVESLVSVDITWGSMSFTYSDEQVEQADGSTADKGWSAEGNTVTVATAETNTAESVSVSAAFTWADTVGEGDAAVKVSDLGIDYEWKDSISSATLTATNTSCTFTLNLTGKPAKGFSGTVGTVTLTITQAATD